MKTCDAKGRDCIEERSSKTFQCNTTCVGIYADVQWVKKDIEMDFSEENPAETMTDDLEPEIDDDLMELYLLLQNHMKLMKNDIKNEMKKDIGEVMKIATGQRGEEFDREKYKMLINEYRKFKTRNVKHVRFNSAAIVRTFGKSRIAQHPKMTKNIR